MHSVRCSTRCARQFRLLSNNLYFWLFLLLAAGVVLYGAGTFLLRALDRRPEHGAKSPAWPTLIDETLGTADAQTRLDLIERLALVPSPWSTTVLNTARDEERDPQVRSAIDAALKNG